MMFPVSTSIVSWLLSFLHNLVRPNYLQLSTLRISHQYSCLTYAWHLIFLLCLFKFYSSFTLSSSSNIIFQWGLYLITQLITSTFCSYISPIIMPLYFSCLLKNCLGIVLHCMCNSKKYSQYAQRMNWLGCEIWQRSRTNWAVCLALVSSG